MDLVAAFNYAMTGVAALFGWIARVHYQEIKDLKDAALKLPETYVRRDDHQAVILELRASQNASVGAIFTKLDRIEDKLDRKADK